MTLQDFFQQHPDTALAFSGGVDSAYLLYAALNWGRRVRAYFVRSAFQPDFELRDAQRLADELGASLTVLDADVLSVPRIAENPPDRCYYCKQTLFRTVLDAAAKDGFPVLMDGTNASDNAGERPGMRAVQGRYPAAFQSGGAVYLGETRLRLPCYPDSRWGQNHCRKAPECGSGRGFHVLFGLFRFPGAAPERLRQNSDSRRTDSAASGA